MKSNAKKRSSPYQTELEPTNKRAKLTQHTTIATNVKQANLSKIPILRKEAQTKKLVINTLKNIPKLPENFQKQTWEKLSTAVAAIHQSTPINDSKESLYNLVKDLCTHKMEENSYNSLQNQCKLHLQKKKGEIMAICRTLDCVSFLGHIEKLWTDHCIQMKMIRDIFLHLDRTYVLQQTAVKSIWDLGIQLFRIEIFKDGDIINKTIDGVLELIKRERGNELIQRSSLQSIIRMLAALNLYSTQFEPVFLDKTQLYYEKQGSYLVNSEKISSYILHIEKSLQEESERIIHYLEAETKAPLLEIVDTELIAKHSAIILEKGFIPMVEEDMREDLHRIYKLFSKVNKIDELRTHFNKYVRVNNLYFQIHSLHRRFPIHFPITQFSMNPIHSQFYQTLFYKFTFYSIYFNFEINIIKKKRLLDQK